MTNRAHCTTFVFGTMLMAMASLAQAQASAPATGTPGIDQRQTRQEQRIDQGVASGSLTQHEANKLERQQSHIDHVENKAKADGNVTGKERAHLHRMQDRASARIHHNKHDRQHRHNAQ